MDLRPGTRLRSQVCATEVVIVRQPSAALALSCGGVPMIDQASTPADDVVADRGQLDGNLLGKRYTLDDDPLEVLVTKAGEGTLGAGSQPLVIRGAKPLPSSD
jgi:hypothetical protein